MCGVLTQRGYGPSADLKLLVPALPNKPKVRRYLLVDKHPHLPGFLGAHVNWWVCVEKGGIIREPSTDDGTGDYGILKVEEFSVDFTNGERGVE